MRYYEQEQRIPSTRFLAHKESSAHAAVRLCGSSCPRTLPQYIKLVTKRTASFCSIVAQMIIVLSRRTQSLNEGGYGHSLTRMIVPVVYMGRP